MSLKVSAEDLIPCVYRFLVKYGHTAAAKALEKSAEVEPRGGISTKKLLKIGKFYLKHHPELVAKEESEEESEEEVVVKKSKKAEKSLNSKRKPTKEIEEEEESEEEKPVKESKKKIKTESANGVKARKQSKTIEEEEEESEEEETTKKSQKNKVKEAPIKEKSAADAQIGFVGEEEGEEEDNRGRFQYVDHSVLTGVPEFLQDNTFQSKTLYGNGGDAFGQFGHERLIHTRGKGFTKEKNKLKNKQFHGGAGRINAHVTNSIKLSYDD